MSFSLPRIILGGLALLTTALGSPVPAAESPEIVGAGIPQALQKRTVGGVYMCTAINWGGYCEYNVYALGQCWQTTGDLSYTVSSFGPDQNTMCTYYYDRDCQDRGGLSQQLAGVIVYPGASDLRPYWNDAIGSFRCVAWTPGG